jgi:hypothetical protein
MGYEPRLDDDIALGIEEEVEPIKCFRCSDELDEDEIVWADIEGQIVKEGNDTAWCVACLPSEGESK